MPHTARKRTLFGKAVRLAGRKVALLEKFEIPRVSLATPKLR